MTGRVLSAIALPLASRAVTVIVLVSVPAAIELGDATTVDCAAETPPVRTTTGSVCVAAVAPIVADTTFDSATVDASEPVAMPAASVTATGPWVIAFPAPVAASVTVAPLTALPNASRAVTAIVLPVLPALIVSGAALTADCAARWRPGYRHRSC